MIEMKVTYSSKTKCHARFSQLCMSSNLLDARLKTI